MRYGATRCGVAWRAGGENELKAKFHMSILELTHNHTILADAGTVLVTHVCAAIVSGMFGICTYGLSVTTDLFPLPDIRLSGFTTEAILCGGCFLGAGKSLSFSPWPSDQRH